MIIYSKALWQLPLALRLGRGTGLTRNLLLPALSTAETVLLFLFTCRHVTEPFDAASGDDGGDALVETSTCSVKWCVLPARYAGAQGVGAVPHGRSLLTRRIHRPDGAAHGAGFSTRTRSSST
jgi:hypothetical protein